jgi:dihydroorotase
MASLLLRNVLLVNEGTVTETDILVQNGRIHTLGKGLGVVADHTIHGEGRLHVLPGLIDDQVHFREPGLTHKGEIRTEARAAVAGGITSYMEMPNTQPPAFTQELLQQKYDRAAEVSLANYSFYMGTSPDNLDEVLRTDPRTVCGVKIFMGSSTGNLLVDDPDTLQALFSRVPNLIATHCEHEPTIRANMEAARARWGEEVPVEEHPNIRSAEGCWRSSHFAVELAKQHGTRLHVLHISTARETELFRNDESLLTKRITAEACIHHLWFTDADYPRLSNRIKWNPAIKTAADREAIWQAVRDGRIDVIATDHAPHTLDEKAQPYFRAPSGGPLVQHSLLALLECVNQGRLSLPDVPRLAAHQVADIFRLQERGYVREGYWADLAIVDLQTHTPVTPASLHYKCGWSPFEGHTFPASVVGTVVSGHLAYWNGTFDERQRGHRLLFATHH